MEEGMEDTGVKYLSLNLFKKFNKAGWRAIYEHAKGLIYKEQNDNDEKISDDQPVSLVYGFVKFSRLCAATLLWIPSFIFDIRLGLYSSRWFVFASYLTSIVSTLIGCVVANLFFSLLFRSILPEIANQVSFFVTTTARIVMNLYAIYSCATLAHIVYYRKFLNDFILYKCSNIRVGKNDQTKTLIPIFFSSWICGILAEPLFIFLTMKAEFIQPNVLPAISGDLFWLIKWIATPIIVIGAATLSILQSIVPMMTSFLICMIEKYIDRRAGKLMSRLYEFEAKQRSNLKNIHLTDLMDDNLNRILSEHSIDTLCDDWPEIDEESDSMEELNDNSIGFYDHNHGQYQNFIPKKDYHLFKSLAFGSRIFLFRNLIKNLIELKDIIAEYSQLYGILHLLFVCLGGLLVAQWTVLGMIQSGILLKIVDKNEQINFVNPIYTRTACSAIVFLTTNTITFIRCNRLPSRLQKLRSQLFRVNLDLLGLCGEDQDNSKSTYQELQLAWSLYDQLCVTSYEVNFKLTGTTNYSKHCLLLIFGREISLILLYLQLIDIYSTA